METKPLLYGIIGFILGGLLVSIVATTQDEDRAMKGETPITSQHSQTTIDQLNNLQGDSFDKKFIDEMSEHHKGAIDMANLIESNAKHDELKKLGRDIISAQSKEIEMMQNWQNQWGYAQTSQ